MKLPKQYCKFNMGYQTFVLPSEHFENLNKVLGHIHEVSQPSYGKEEYYLKGGPLEVELKLIPAATVHVKPEPIKGDES